ncbi:MAG: efflux RND transporter periplasmic adaptor subunit [Pseudomonadales bacterium]|nr:efflux RND transporter periplasmic adaptor subunit [Candidatus Woesebacteria bacterium]MCB9801797.1 efflux RND transporter periplasmic adaptor subunit [Pseudomonadales bacterium]
MKKTQTFLNKHWKKLLLFLILFAGVGALVYAQAKPEVEEVVTAHPEIKTITQTLDVSGIVDAKTKAALSFAGGGKLVSLNVKEGEYVGKGALIASLDQALLNKQLWYELNTFKKERIDWDQTLDDFEETNQTIEDNRAKEKDQLDLDNSVLKVEMQSLAFRDARLTAPFAGVITALPVPTAGIVIGPQDVFELVDPTTLVMRAAVDETDIAKVTQGLSARVTLDAHPDDEVRTQVSYISPTSQQSSTGTVFVVELPLDTVAGLNYYRLGMNGDVTIIIQEKTGVLSVPIDATIVRDEKTYVEVQHADGSLEEKEIEVGIETENEVEVVQGLSTQDSIVIPS